MNNEKSYPLGSKPIYTLLQIPRSNLNQKPKISNKSQTLQKKKFKKIFGRGEGNF